MDAKRALEDPRSQTQKSPTGTVGLRKKGQQSWLRGLDLNQRPSGYEPDELPGCSTPRQLDPRALCPVAIFDLRVLETLRVSAGVAGGAAPPRANLGR